MGRKVTPLKKRIPIFQKMQSEVAAWGEIETKKKMAQLEFDPQQAKKKFKLA